MSFSLFAACAPGLEPATAQELRRLNLANLNSTPGGVAFRGSQRDLYRTNLELRTASRILVRIGDFHTTAFADLRAKASRLPWEAFLRPGQTLALKVTCHKSKLYHSDAIAERIVGAIEDRLGGKVNSAKGDDEADTHPAQLVLARCVRDRCVISLDSSGALLHQRGYRLATAKAPLRETLAAGMLLASGWDKTSPLLDPFCGSGTVAIEAALLAMNRAPGRARRFAFMEWPDFDAAQWSSLLADADARIISAAPLILASDRDAGAIEAACANAERAGALDRIQFSRRAVSAIEPPAAHGWVITNPPYGVRVSANKNLRNLYAQFGKTLRARCPGWRVVLLSAEANLTRSAGLDFTKALAWVNGGLRVHLMLGSVPAKA